jgi:hypothetical protein
MAARKCRLFSDVAALRLAARKPRSTRKHRTSFGKILLIVTTLSGEGSASLAVRRTLNGTRSVSLTLCFFQVDRTVTSAEAGESSGYRNFATFCRLTYVGAGIVTTHTMLASPDCRRLTARVVRVFPRRCASSPSLFLYFVPLLKPFSTLVSVIPTVLRLSVFVTQRARRPRRESSPPLVPRFYH